MTGDNETDQAANNEPTFRERLAKYLGCSIDELSEWQPNFAPPPQRMYENIRRAEEIRLILMRIKAAAEGRVDLTD